MDRLASLFLLLLAAATGPAPVRVVPAGYVPQHSGHGEYCNLAVVERLLPGHSLSVRSGPGLNHPRVDRLGDGERVYTCNESREWVGVVYARPGAPCGARASRPLDARRAGTCASGWVHQNWIVLISG